MLVEDVSDDDNDEADEWQRDDDTMLLCLLWPRLMVVEMMEEFVVVVVVVVREVEDGMHDDLEPVSLSCFRLLFKLLITSCISGRFSQSFVEAINACASGGFVEEGVTFWPKESNPSTRQSLRCQNEVRRSQERST